MPSVASSFRVGAITERDAHIVVRLQVLQVTPRSAPRQNSDGFPQRQVEPPIKDPPRGERLQQRPVFLVFRQHRYFVRLGDNIPLFPNCEMAETQLRPSMNHVKLSASNVDKTGSYIGSSTGFPPPTCHLESGVYLPASRRCSNFSHASSGHGPHTSLDAYGKDGPEAPSPDHRLLNAVPNQ